MLRCRPDLLHEAAFGARFCISVQLATWQHIQAAWSAGRLVQRLQAASRVETCIHSDGLPSRREATTKRPAVALRCCAALRCSALLCIIPLPASRGGTVELIPLVALHAIRARVTLRRRDRWQGARCIGRLLPRCPPLVLLSKELLSFRMGVQCYMHVLSPVRQRCFERYLTATAGGTWYGTFFGCSLATT